ncbi:unnamed protein product (macronuclear) [Paramecium tetraurelia]|uniref:Trichocyst matrix protein n=1 Tax=Paramecium tetraurelia TaxID=5888 RepID=A0EAJ4_PARTE|nr:uncharacterized protein GSPATT00025045001 [Paramecium tetraurelia]CAK92311.1 unnamed protein product [Paramecium tetraurelia]|eukprot:XP_001459708.1 hypothetical protein (macronuclear) [Paramecium tetraurelia strain d4-2]
MKSVTGVLVILLLSQSVLCSPKKINTDFLNLLSSKTNVMSSQDAIQSVLTLLEDLQGANVEAQDKADLTFQRFENAILQDINEFSGIVNVNSKSAAAASQDLEAVDLKIQQTTDYLNWNNKRYKANELKLENLAEQRCEANALFIDTLREYKNALSVLDWVRSDAQSKQTNLVEKSHVGDYAEKLSKYANLFEEQAVQDFVKLGDDEASFSQTRQRGNGEQLVQLMTKDVVGVIQQLIEKLRDTIKGLEEQEIQSANDFADFKTNLLAEQESLKQEYDAKAKFLNSLQNDKELASDILTKKKELQDQSMRILSLTQEEYNYKKKLYNSEKDKRHEENQLLEESLLIYREKIATVNEYLKKRVNEYVGDSLIEEHAVSKQQSVSARKGQ